LQKYIEDPVSEHIITDRMFGGGHGNGKLRVSLAKDKENTLVEWV
jgi:hypothetical protein